jgi:molecular chaperone HtpG
MIIRSPRTRRRTTVTSEAIQNRYEFQAETRRLLELMIHSLYSNKEIFLRELISNSSDALDKRRFAAVKDASLAPDGDLQIRIETDADARTITVSDNGIGMSRQEVIDNIGTIARSGSQELLSALSEAGEAERPELIGQFGVGFYSSFLVADEVTLVTRKVGEETATRWQSDGAGAYTVEEARRSEPGTSVTLHLKPVDDDDGIADYTDRWVIESIVRKYSDFVAYPIKMEVEASKPATGDDAKLVGQTEDKTLNSMKAIWARAESEVDDADYSEFYKHISHDWTDPFGRVLTSIEGTFEARALLFLPSRAPFDLYRPDVKRRGVQLYVKRVFIMDDCEELLPGYLRFVKGVVDCEDLPLNVSREILQQNRQVRAIRKHLVKKVLDYLAGIMRDDRERYETWWRSFGAVLKEGLLLSQERNEKIFELVLAPSTRSAEGLTSLDDYLERAPEDQEVIYYLSTPSLDKGRRSPHLEAFEDNGIEVLFFTDQVDEIWLQERAEYKGKRFASITAGELDLGADEGDRDDSGEAGDSDPAGKLSELLMAVRSTLQEQVKDVRASTRLRSSPACLVTAEGDLTPQMERLLRATGQEVPATRRILELNPSHRLIERMAEMLGDGAASDKVASYARLLYGQAILAEGGELDDPAEFARLVAELMVDATSR